jgi:hypothetical protein
VNSFIQFPVLQTPLSNYWWIQGNFLYLIPSIVLILCLYAYIFVDGLILWQKELKKSTTTSHHKNFVYFTNFTFHTFVFFCSLFFLMIQPTYLVKYLQGLKWYSLLLIKGFRMFLSCLFVKSHNTVQTTRLVSTQLSLNKTNNYLRLRTIKVNVQGSSSSSSPLWLEFRMIKFAT